MTKPIIFFGHSSTDKDMIIPIKEHILDRTGNAVSIFLSSDGASIPFGTNWLGEVEDALKDCKLMFVWVTPNSIKSDWIYFESGYAYSRGIKVIPIGFDGTKLEEVTPPLSILQGFNINSSSGLNNIVAVINKEFGYSFPDIFDDSFYEDYSTKYSSENMAELLEYVNGIKCAFSPNIKNTEDNTLYHLKQDWPAIIEKLLKDSKQQFTNHDNDEFFGIGFNIYASRTAGPNYPTILIDPLSINNIWKLLVDIFNNIYDAKPSLINLTIILNSLYEIPIDHYLISARLLNTEVSLNTPVPTVVYGFRNIKFRILIPPRGIKGIKELILFVDKELNETIPVLSLIKLLLKQKVIVKKHKDYS